MESRSGIIVFDLIVIGAGVMGSSTAYRSSKLGHRTILLEQYDFLHHRGSSHGESRTIRATYPEVYYTAMARQAAELWAEAEADAGFRVHIKTSQLDVGPANASLRAVVSSCRKTSLPHSVLNAEELSRMFSGRMSIPEDWTAVTTDLGGVIKPTKAVSMFQMLAVRNGAVLKDNMEVSDIRRDEIKGGIVVSTSTGEEFIGRKCVVTAGAWTRKLVNKVSGLELPIQPLETMVSYWRIKPGHEGDFSITRGGGGNFPTFASYGNPYIYGTPSLEYPGLIKVGVHGGRPCDPDSRPWRTSFRFDALRKWIEEVFRGSVDASEPVSTQSCMYSMTPDEDFVIDFLGGEEFREDVVVGGGFSGHGFKMAPLVAKVLVDLAFEGKAEGVEMRHFRIGRFAEDPRGNVKDYMAQVGILSSGDDSFGAVE
ncbi:hypothetical protein SAY87_026029 [Trapa incisa]|uniref:FAD dependent oxidoreductase domain-containing protein n=1 Tax=Trapa incisa TaxID=236973 RepID=A0AAN7JJX3_9MYRT|nr:hypothetical protein SAY87_026029 [Trapa incisa]